MIAHEQTVHTIEGEAIKVGETILVFKGLRSSQTIIRRAIPLGEANMRCDNPECGFHENPWNGMASLCH
jgi:hypothetical protein